MLNAGWAFSESFGRFGSDLLSLSFFCAASAPADPIDSARQAAQIVDVRTVVIVVFRSE